MDFLTIDLVKKHCRIEDYSKDPDRQRKIDETIKKCANLAEGIVYEHIGKDYPAIMKEYGEIPIRITLAALMATSDMILERDPKENYTLKMILKPYKNKEPRIMRKAKITGCVAKTVGYEMTNATIGVGFKVGRYERYAHVVFPIEIAKTYIDRNINQKSELLTERLMKYVREELDHWNEGDADTTDLENIMRLKMPFLLRKAVNMEYFTQTFK